MFDIQQRRQEKIKKICIVKKKKTHNLAGVMCETNRLKLLPPVTAAEISIHAQMTITSTVYSFSPVPFLFFTFILKC